MLPQQFNINRINSNIRNQRGNKYIRNLLLAVLLLFATTIIGIIGFVVIDDYSLAEAFYMTIITLSTVGFGEVKPLSTEGQIFTAILVVFNLGVFAYAITIISNLFLEGELRTFLKDYKMLRKIKALKNHTIVCGYGRHGKQVCEELLKSNHPFLVIEPNEAKVEELRQQQFYFIQGDATHDHVLLSAGIQQAKTAVVTYIENALNVYTVLTARHLSPQLNIVTRASDHTTEKKLMRAGANHVVMTEVIGGFYMATLINQPNVVEFFRIISNMGEVAIHFKEVQYNQLRQQFRDKKIKDLSLRTQTGINIIGVKNKKGRYDVNPNPDTLIEKEMTLVILGDFIQIQKFVDLIMLKEPPSPTAGLQSAR